MQNYNDLFLNDWMKKKSVFFIIVLIKNCEYLFIKYYYFIVLYLYFFFKKCFLKIVFNQFVNIVSCLVVFINFWFEIVNI